MAGKWNPKILIRSEQIWAFLIRSAQILWGTVKTSYVESADIIEFPVWGGGAEIQILKMRAMLI